MVAAIGEGCRTWGFALCCVVLPALRLDRGRFISGVPLADLVGCCDSVLGVEGGVGFILAFGVLVGVAAVAVAVGFCVDDMFAFMPSFSS